VAPGHDASFQITVRNAGSVTLHDVKVSDRLTPGCDRTIGTLARGASVTYGCRSSGVSSGFTNTADATGVSPRGVTVSASDYAVVGTGTTTPAPPAENAPPFTG
jgi:uncharacterized repeat protein (TIGR01451 family)